MNIAYHSSDAYARILAVSVASLFENNQTCDEINVYIIERGITDENKIALESIAQKYGRNIIYIPMPDINEKEDLRLKKVKKKWIFDSYCRLYLDDLLPDSIDKVLYLDSDVLIADSLQELWDTDLSNHVAAGVKDCISRKYYELLGLKDGAHYCNSGVILINLKKWRDDHIGDQIRQFVHNRNGYVFFMEQTVMNGVIQDKWLILPVRYNVNTLMMMLSYREIQTLRRSEDFYNEDEVKEALEHPALIHMTSVFLVHNRTWIEGSNHPAKPLYEKYKALTPWADASDLPDKRNLWVKMQDKIIDVLPNRIMLLAVSLIYNNARISNIKRKMKKYSGTGVKR